MDETSTLANKKIIVTGAARGIGASATRALAAAGAMVTGLDLSGPSADTAESPPSSVFAYETCDVSSRASTRAAVDRAVAAMGGLDVLIHAAGVQRYTPAEAITDEEWELVVGVNARGTMIANQAVFPHLKDRGGRIVNFASAAGALGLRGCAHYAASKGAVLAWTRTIAQEWGPYGISVNAIAPGMWTPMYDATRAGMTPEQLEAHDRGMAMMIPLGGRLGDPDADMAPVLVFLASDASRFITGQTLAVDGGLMMVR
ncbi:MULTISPECIES: SDR family NAD(P)-dependent oxidoreductase [Brevundimonas]|uniref:D-xylose 1-dehydrogenase n=1 Tax=Brevundimonas bullata TaxID=13160 RepID=A0A7W7N618_9CAUL|nr:MULTISPECIES: SDR family oxidoreductase [Brevundimonas]MBB4799802.1 NAD(P)-dependent dehydrogenase (short-subunit alcohol dehydrogenase family) [Brevundimonas bullata]MBB6384760.1 NAD(P)-dependent dehydrogenase (short-subunit alcohol dehydrogenase family) [Brevundimonas bullata]NWE54288.1 SDR family oxidoreductase [Brevundimonas sp. P7753]